jgi:hypothetical protein
LTPAAHADSHTQTDDTTTSTVNVDIQTAFPSTMMTNAGVQTARIPEQKMAEVQTEPLDDDQSRLSKGIKNVTKTSPTIVVDPQLESQASRSALLHDELVETPERKITPTPPLLVPEPSRRFDWAEDAESLPIVPQLPPRDLSVLCSNIP